MTDIFNPKAMLESRFQWAQDGYEETLRQKHRGSGIGDVDGHLELSGNHLYIEQKWWDGTGRPPAITGGQKYALHSIVRRSIDVLIIWSERGSVLQVNGDSLRLVGDSSPLAARMLTFNHVANVVASTDYLFGEESTQRRRELLRDVIDQWATKADATPASRCPFCGVHSVQKRWAIQIPVTQPRGNTQ